MAKSPVGEVTHYYSNLGVAIVKLNKGLKVGDKVHVEGHSTNFDQVISEMQLDHANIEAGKKGQDIGLKVSEKVREGDKVHST